MLGKKLVMKDIESIDPEFYNSLKWIKYVGGGEVFQTNLLMFTTSKGQLCG